jgi:hypothetical protein
VGLALAINVPVRAAELEKISSPAQIKDFRVIKNVGTALYGWRIASSTLNQSTSTASSTLDWRLMPGMSSTSRATTSSSTLEKIAGPSLINLYKNIKKIGTALWGELKNGGRTKTQSASSTPVAIVIDSSIASCVNTAISTKDQAIEAAVTAAATSLNTAIGARSTCQQSAVSATSGQGAALRDCVQVFQAARQEINQAAKDAQSSAWTTYASSLKACQASSTTATSSELMIEDGGSDTPAAVLDSGNSH